MMTKNNRSRATETYNYNIIVKNVKNSYPAPT